MRHLHGWGLCHGDLSPKNILVRPAGTDAWQFYLLDLDALRLWKPLTMQRRLKGLSQLNDLPVSWPRTDRLRFWRVYWGRGREHPRAQYGLVGRMTDARNL
jgi:hypothetical protein